MIPAARAREHERIRAVYAYYDSSETEQRKRDGSNPGTRLNAARRWLALRQVITGLDLRAEATILDVGCGSGGDLQRIAREFGYLRPSLHGVDLLSGRIDQTRALLPQARLRVAGGEQLDYQDRFFDLVLASTVFSSILDAGLARASQLRWLGSPVTTGSSCATTCATRIRGTRMSGPFAVQTCGICSPPRAYGSRP